MSLHQTPRLRRFKHIHALTPPPVYRFARHAALDLLSIPGRVSRRLSGASPGPQPWYVLHNFGGGDFYASGRAILDRLTARVALFPSARVLDIGCGSGRTAWALTEVLGPDGAYLGFDVSRPALRFARRLLARERPDFVFEHADLHNGEYNARGRLRAADYVFPCEDAWADVVVATSLFTHLVTDDARRFFSEVARVLKPGGQAYVTAFLVDEAARGRLEAGQALYALLRHDPPLWVGDPRTPEMATGYDEAAFLALLDEAGLALAHPVWRGSWSGAENTADFQDALVLERRSDG